MSVFVFYTLSPIKRVARNCRKFYATTFAYSHLCIYEPLNSLLGYSILTGGVVNRVRGICVLPAGVVRCQSQVSSSFAPNSPFLGLTQEFCWVTHALDIPCIGSGGAFEAIKLSKVRVMLLSKQ